MKSLKELQDAIASFCDERDWGSFHNPKDLAISLSLEASEVLEQFQWKSESEIRAHLAENREEVADELADVLYWLLLMSKNFDVDLATAFEEKMKKNAKKYPVDKAKGNHKKYTEL